MNIRFGDSRFQKVFLVEDMELAFFVDSFLLLRLAVKMLSPVVVDVKTVHCVGKERL